MRLTYRGTMSRSLTPALLALLLLTLSPLARAQELEGASSEPEAERAAVPTIGDALTFETDDGRFGIKPLAHLQTYFFIQRDLALEGDTGAGFLVRRARLGLDGHLFTKDLRFQLEGHWDRGQPALRDAYVRYELTPLAVIQGGLFKRPFSRDFLTSSSKTLTFERALPTRRFFTSRDVGVMLHNNFEKSPGIEYAVGVFNGSGDPFFFDRMHPTFVGRVGANLNDIDGYSEGDLEGGPFRFAVALSAALDAPTDTNPGLATAELDFALKAYGAWATGALYVESGPLDGRRGNSHLGLHLKGSYTLADFLLPVLGYGMVAPLGGNTARHEITAGAALLLYGHHVKLLTDAVLGMTQAPGAFSSDVGVRFGVSLGL